MTMPPIYGSRDDGSPATTVAGAPDRDTADVFNSTGAGRRGTVVRRIGTVVMLVAAGALVLSSAVTVVLRLGATVTVGPAVVAALVAAVAVITVLVRVLAGEDAKGRRPVSSAVLIAAVLVAVLVSVGLYVWAVV